VMSPLGMGTPQKWQFDLDDDLAERVRASRFLAFRRRGAAASRASGRGSMADSTAVQ
jgi:hypothetical protein